MSTLIFKAKLVQVQNSVDTKTGLPKIRLVFASQRFDKGLDQIVPVSQPVTLIEGHHHLREFYLTLVNKEIYLPIEESTQMSGFAIFYKTTGDGKPLYLEEKKAPELTKTP